MNPESEQSIEKGILLVVCRSGLESASWALMRGVRAELNALGYPVVTLPDENEPFLSSMILADEADVAVIFNGESKPEDFVDLCTFFCPTVTVDSWKEDTGLYGLVSVPRRQHAIAETLANLLREPTARRCRLEEQRRWLVKNHPDRLQAWLPMRMEGPFDSSYSLARLNREIALALAERVPETGIFSTEGPGDFEPAKDFLSEHADVALLWERGRHAAGADIVLRNLFPPRLNRMKGPLRALAAYNWEESGLPAEYVRNFNHRLELITVASRHVEKILIDNGVHTPVVNIGLGADHRLSLCGDENLPALPAKFRFLHVSSGFPRKGIDVLLEAWGRAFHREDGVSLIIKTFPNPHNRVQEELAEMAVRHPEHAPVLLVSAELSDAALSRLYQACDAFVAPSRGEGFGLPFAEAMRHGLPVIATAHGGHADFCTEETAWLVDYHFARADSHFNLPDSVWAEPDTDHLSLRMKEVLAAPAEELERRTSLAREKIARDFSWDKVAARLNQAVARVHTMPPLPLRPRVAWVSTWNTRCGIATYSRYLAARMKDCDMTLLAPCAGELVEPDEPWVYRCWRQGWSDPLHDLEDAIATQDAEVVIIQFNFGFFRLQALGALLDRLADRRIPVFLFLHSTRDVQRDTTTLSLREITKPLSRVFRICVHGLDDLNRLKDINLVDNVTLFPHGVSGPSVSPLSPLRPDFLQGRRVLASYGFLLPHKGLTTLIEALHLLHVDGQKDLHLLLVNARHTAPESMHEEENCRHLIKRLGLDEHVTMLTEFLPEAKSLDWLRMADLIIFPYQHTQESASGAVRIGLAAGRPVAVTPLPIFDDVAAAVETLPGMDAAALSDGIGALLSEPERLATAARRQREWVRQREWTLLGARLSGMINAARHRAVWGKQTFPLISES